MFEGCALRRGRVTVRDDPSRALPRATDTVVRPLSVLLFVVQIMAHVVQSLDQPSNYKDSQSRVDRNRQNDLLAKSSTLYVCCL